MRSDNDDASAVAVGTSTGDTTYSNHLQALESGGDTQRDWRLADDGIDSNLRQNTRHVSDAPETHNQILMIDYEISSAKVHDDLLASRLGAAGGGRLQLSSFLQKKRERQMTSETTGPQARTWRRRRYKDQSHDVASISKENDDDNDDMEDVYEILPGAFSVEGTINPNDSTLESQQVFETLSAPDDLQSHIIQSPPGHPLQSLVAIAAVAHLVVDENGGPTIHRQTSSSMVAVIVEEKEICGIPRRSCLCAAFGFVLATIVATIAVALALTLTQGKASETIASIPTLSPTMIAQSPTNPPSRQQFLYPKSTLRAHTDGGDPFDHLE